MGCLQSKEADVVVSEHSIPILDVIRPLTKDVAESFNAEEYQR